MAAVLLYRILSFWAELPVGWVTWAVATLADRGTGSTPEVVPESERVEEAVP